MTEKKHKSTHAWTYVNDEKKGELEVGGVTHNHLEGNSAWRT